MPPNANGFIHWMERLALHSTERGAGVRAAVAAAAVWRRASGSWQ